MGIDLALAHKKRKLAIFAGLDMMIFGGGEKYVIEFANRLKDFDVTIFSFHGKPPYRLTMDQVKERFKGTLEYYDAPEIPIARERLIFTGSGLAALKKLKDFDVVYCLDNSFFTNFMLTRYSKKYGFKYILGIHDANFLRDTPIKDSPLRKVLLKVYGPIRDAGIMSAPNLRIINDLDAQKLRKMGYKGTLYAITDFINVKDSTKTHVDAKNFTVLFIGRLSVIHKGIDILGDVIDKVIAKNNKVVFHIVGSGDGGEDMVREMVKRHPKNVKWLGFVNERTLVKEFQDASLFAFPSRFESFGVSLAEAQAYGLPAVSFDVRGPKLVMKDKIQGKLIEPFDADAFASQVLNYYKMWERDKKAYAALKSSISRVVLSRFGEKVIFPKLVRMLSEDDKSG